TDPVILMLAEKMQIAGQDLLADLDHLLGLEAGIDLQIAQRAIESLDMLLHLETAAVEGPRHVEDAVTLEEAAIAPGDHHLALRHVVPVEIGDALIGERGHASPCERSETRQGPVFARLSWFSRIAFPKARAVPSPRWAAIRWTGLTAVPR